MQQLTEAQIRDAFVNASRKEVSDVTLPPGFHEVDWERRDYLGWTDPKLGRRAYAVIPVDDELVAIVFERARKLPTRRAMCSWCEDVTLPNDVVFYSAKRTGMLGAAATRSARWCAQRSSARPTCAAYPRPRTSVTTGMRRASSARRTCGSVRRASRATFATGPSRPNSCIRVSIR